MPVQGTVPRPACNDRRHDPFSRTKERVKTRQTPHRAPVGRWQSAGNALSRGAPERREIGCHGTRGRSEHSMRSDLNHILAHCCISCLIPMRTSKVVEVAAGRMQITPVRWTKTGRVALLMFTRSRRMRNSGIRSWGLVRVGLARMKDACHGDG